MDPLVDDGSVAVEEKDGGVGDPALVVPDLAPELRVMAIQVIVQHPQVADDAAALVGEQRIRDPVLRGKSRERLDGVVADRKQRDLGAGEVGGDALQLDELRLTVGSPPRTSVEDDERAAAPARLVQADGRAALIGQRYVGKRRADRRPLPAQFV